MNRKANIGVGILVMALLLLIGAVFLNSDDRRDNKDRDNIVRSGKIVEEYLFYLNKTTIGRQRKVTESFPNIELGSRVDYDTIYVGNTFRLVANPFTSNVKNVIITNPDFEDVNYYMVYYDVDKLSGENIINVRVNGRLIAETSGKGSEIPIVVPKIANESFYISFEIEKPAFYSLFNWNKYDFSDFKVVAVRQNKDNGLKTFNFDIDKEYLDKVYVDMVVSCYEQTNELGEAIKVKVNDYILSDTNARCSLRNNRVQIQIPTNILTENKNEISFETSGFYKVAYGLNKVYFNDKDTYKFTVADFEDMVDVIIYGEFDADMLDLKINNKIISLERDEIRSIWSYLRFGTNEIEILNKPVEIEELVIEATEHWDYN